MRGCKILMPQSSRWRIPACGPYGNISISV
jgi:hypothetical protein